jgi:putative flippase GtrA
MALIETTLNRIPEPLRSVLFKHREMLKFAVVGGICFAVTNVVNYGLKFTILNDKPVTALVIAVLVATIVSYVLNREWSFRTRGGRERHHEAALFFLISGIGLALNAFPLWVSRYMLDLEVPRVSLLVQEVSDFTAGIIIGTLLAMVFRLWAFKKWVFPQAGVRPRVVREERRALRRAARGSANRAA